MQSKFDTYPQGRLIFELAPYDAALQNVGIINAKTLPHKVIIHMPDVISNSYVLYQLSEILPNKGIVDYTDKISRIPNHPWFDILADSLDWSIGQHIYKATFVQKHTSDMCDLYFSFILQNDDPEKPYDYMSKYRIDCKESS